MPRISKSPTLFVGCPPPPLPLLSFPNKIFGPTFSSCPHILPFIMDHILEMLTLTTKISSTVRIFRSSIMNYFEILVGIKSIKIYPKQCIFPSTSPLAKNVSPFNFALAHSIFPTTLFCKFLSFFCELTVHCIYMK